MEDFHDHRTLFRPDRIIYWQAKTARGWSEINTNPAFICNLGKELVAEAEAGNGLALVPGWAVKEQVAEKRLIPIQLEDATLALSRNERTGTYLIYQQPKYRLMKIKVAVDFLVKDLTEAED